MLVISLQSGSNGNCLYVEAGGARLLFDAGISARRAEHRLAARGRNIRDVDAVLISHDHADHARSAGVLQRKFHLPLYVTEATLAAAGMRYRLGRLDDVRHFRSGSAVRVGPVTVESVRTPHDGADAVAFVVDDGAARLGVLTDLGHVFPALADVVASLDAVVIESNHDPDLLAAGPYPPHLQDRIRGPGGHICNAEAAELLRAAGSRLRWICIGHLSRDNNAPALALETHRRVLGGRMPIHIAGRYEVTEAMLL